jgi:hypothetical protein
MENNVMCRIPIVTLYARGAATRLFTAFGAVAALIFGFAVSGVPNARANSPLPPPILTCGDAAQTSLDVEVCAPATGAPAGFGLKWFAPGGEFTGWPPGNEGVCKALFYRTALLRGYNLKPGQCVTLSIGELLLDEAAKTNCTAALTCGTQYVFKSFSRATATRKRSAFSSNLFCSTLPCGHADSCTFTQGHWKTHGPIPKGGNENEWPVTGLTVGNIVYTDLQLLSILEEKVAGNGLVSLAHQLIAVKLNVASGADDTAIAASILAADTLIGALVIPSVGGGSLDPATTSALTDTLTAYNEGSTGPGHCDEATNP